MRNWINEKWQKFKNSKLFLATICFAIGISWTVAYYEFQGLWNDYQEALTIFNSIEWQNEVEAIKASARVEELPAPKEEASIKLDAGEETIPSPSLGEIIDKIAILESSGGKYQPSYCTNRGLTNKYGYGVYGNKIHCFQNDEEARTIVASWFKSRVDEGCTLEESLCYWNTGSKTENCEYVEKFKKLT